MIAMADQMKAQKTVNSEISVLVHLHLCFAAWFDSLSCPTVEQHGIA